MTYKEKITWLQRYLKAREQARFLGDCAQEMEAEAEGMRTRLDGMPGAGRDTARLARSVEKVEETRKMADAALDRCALNWWPSWRRCSIPWRRRCCAAATSTAKATPRSATRWPWWSAASTSCTAWA